MEPSQDNQLSITFTLTVEEASGRFAAAGVPRSPRSVSRYCAQGHLACKLAETPTGQRYLVNEESVEERIEELKQILASSRVETRRDTTSHDRTRPDMTRPQEDELGNKLNEYESKILNLRIDNSAKEQVIGQLVSERKEFLSQLTEQSRMIGTLETQLKQLAAPSERPAGEGTAPDPPPEDAGA